MSSLAGVVGLSWTPPTLGIILPVGISFYTFHTITYIVDSYKGVIRPTRNIFEFAAYVSLFSQLVAGPIVRFRQIEDDLERTESANRKQWLTRGISFFVVGLVEKVVVADTMAAFVDPALAEYDLLSTAGLWLAFAGYSMQLYFDFAGYSDMAVGLGYLFALRIPQNFNSPYKALDPSDFWRRWHISLSSCLRDYVYIPLGGNRHGERKAYRNLTLTMLIGGLWHGANWTFLVWGLYHGVLLALFRRFAAPWNVIPALIRQATMFVFVLIGWVFFRSNDLQMAGKALGRMFSYTPGTLGPNAEVFTAALLVTMVWAMAGPNVFDMHEDPQFRPGWRVGLAAAFGICIALMLGGGASPFLYFQF